MEKNHQRGPFFLGKAHFKGPSFILLGNFFLAALGSYLLAPREENPINTQDKKGQKLFERPSTELILFIDLTFPYSSKESPKAFTLLTENKKVLIQKAFLLSDQFEEERDLSLNSGQRKYLIAFPSASLKLLTPHLGKKLWGIPLIPERGRKTLQFIPKNRKRAYEISF